MTVIKMRRGTTAEWAEFDPILSPGEPGVDLNTGEHKIGNGIDHWSDLPTPGGGTVGGVVFSSVVASGTGGADQAAAINAELSALSTFGGGTLVLAGGFHDNLSTITVPGYCTVRGVGWSGDVQGKGTTLRFAPGQSGMILDGPSVKVEDLSLYSLEVGVGTGVGISVRGAHATLREVNVQKFGSHGISVDSTIAGLPNCNLARIDHVRSSHNGGCGLYIKGSDANAGYVTEIDCTANKGAAQISNAGCRWTIWGHLNSAGVGGTTDGVFDNGISNTYNVYIESSAAPGSNFHLGSASTYGVLESLFYAEATTVVADANTAFLSWRIWERDRERYLQIGDLYQGRAGGNTWRFDSGVTVGALRLQNITGSRTAFTVAGDGSYMSFATPPIPSPAGGVDLGRSANKWRDLFMAGVVKLGAYTTATRPTPASAGAGGLIYDSTIGKPIWSNGTAWAASADPIVNVKDYGAVGNGVADDTAAITSALAAGRTIFFPVGTYLISSSLALSTGHRLIGEGNASNGSKILSSHAGAAIVSVTPSTRTYDVRIENLQFEGPGLAVAGSTGLDLSSVSSASVTNCGVTKYEKGIRVRSTISGGAVYNRFYNVTVSVCGVGWSIEASSSNSSSMFGCRANACTTGVAIDSSNDTSWVAGQIESNTLGVQITAASASGNSFLFARFESNTTAWDVGAGVINTRIIHPSVFGTYTFVDNGTRTQHQTAHGPTSKWWSAIAADAAGAWRFERTVAATDLPALVVADSNTGSGAPVTIQAETGRTAGRFFRGVRAGTTYIDLDAAGNILQPVGSYYELTEMTAPAAPAANKVRLFSRDNGAGKTQLCAIFPTGAIQVLSTEP